MMGFKPWVCVAILGVSSSVYATELEQAQQKSAEINQLAKQSQQKINAISDEMASRLNAFRALNKEMDGLAIYNAQLTKQVQNQLLEMDEIHASMDKVSVIERQITPLMLRMIQGLDEFVALDVPFLMAERAKRIASLKSMMDRADVAVSEKFRRVLEAYQIEVDYGRTIEAYTAMLEIDGQSREVDFLRIGRLELLYLTRDGQSAGVWDKASKTWHSLPDTHLAQINKGLRIARKQLAPDLLTLPVSTL